MWTKHNSVDDLITHVLKFGPDLLAYCETAEDLTQYCSRVEQERLAYPVPTSKVNTAEWFVPGEYLQLDIENYLRSICPTENIDRLEQEIALYQQHNMITVLKAIKYIVDTLEANDVVWGVGRGSSVASYVLFLLKAHRIDSVKYQLSLEEFFR